MSVLSRPKTRAALAAAAIGVVAIVAFVVAYPALAPQTSTSTTSGGTRSTTSRTFNSTVVITMPYGVGDNESLNFQPSNVTVVVAANNMIVWNDLDAEQHTVTSMSVPSGAAKFDSGILNQGQTFTLTLTVPGTYEFYCTIHPTWMRGTIVVKP